MVKSMPRKLIKTTALFAAILMLFPANFVRAQSVNSPNLISDTTVVQTEEDKEVDETVEQLTENLKSKLKRGTYYVFGIETKLNNSKEELKLLKKNINQIEDKIAQSKVKIEDLSSQLSNFDRLIEINKEKIGAVELQIAHTNNEILILADDMKRKEDELKKQIASLNSVISTYYLQNNTFFDPRSNEPKLLAFISSQNSTGQIMQENAYLLFLQNASNQAAQEIMSTQNAIDDKRAETEDKKQRILELQKMLEHEKQIFFDAQDSRKRLIDETKGKQAIYEALLEISKKEIEQVNDEIMRLKENYEFFNSKITELKNRPEAAGINIADLNLDEGEQILKGISQLSWPVSPSLGISATFHDSAYRATMGIAHNAIDIRITQGSKVRSAADGVVTKVADNGFGYSYIIIAHADKVVTLYGHISEMLVEEGEVVRQGQVIGLSGGIPGTKGAGWLTTGAHLHFEVFKDFQHVDPLEYLPLEFVPITSLPEKYLKRLSGELNLGVPAW